MHGCLLPTDQQRPVPPHACACNATNDPTSCKKHTLVSVKKCNLPAVCKLAQQAWLLLSSHARAGTCAALLSHAGTCACRHLCCFARTVLLMAWRPSDLWTQHQRTEGSAIHNVDAHSAIRRLHGEQTQHPHAPTDG